MKNSPDAVEVSGKFYKIFTDFRDWIAFFDMMSDTEIDPKQKMLTALSWFKEEIPDSLTEAYKALTDFASCSGIKKNPENQDKNSINSGVPTLSWLYDSAYVLGAFRQVYNIDLIRVEFMHWWEFSALFEALPEDTPIKKAYRIPTNQAVGHQRQGTSETDSENQKSGIVSARICFCPENRGNFFDVGRWDFGRR